MKLSILIPTRERAQFLRHSLATATAIAHPDVEIVVSDNASADETAAVTEEAADSRIRYVRTAGRVSMRQNFENALRHSSGDYVFVMGDDDGIVSGQIPALVRLLEHHAPDMMFWPVPAYRWRRVPEVPKSGQVRLRRSQNFGPVRPADVGRMRADLLACNLKRLRPIPAIYHGVCARPYIERLSLPDGTFFAGHIPDYYVSYLAILRGGNLMQVQHTFSINGEGPKSTGSAMATSLRSAADGQPGERFRHEARQDPRADRLDTSLCVPMAFFGTLETVRTLFPDLEAPPDYAAWYGWLRHEIAACPQDLREAVDGALRSHAEEIGTVAALEGARPAVPPSRRSVGVRLRKALDALTCLSLHTKAWGEDSVQTAVSMVDQVLGRDIYDVLDGNLSRAEAWRRCRMRARKPGAIPSPAPN